MKNQRRACSKAYWDEIEARRQRLSYASTKICGKCRCEKPRSEFGRDAARPGGLRPQCKQCHNAGNAKWRSSNPDRQAELVQRWAKANPDRVKAKMARWNRKNALTVRGRLIWRISNRMRGCLQGKRSKTIAECMSFTIDELRLHLERQFVDGMNWSAFSRGEIHIDHIRPLSSFNFSTVECEGFKQAWQLSNLRPLWVRDNQSKKDKRLFLI